MYYDMTMGAGLLGFCRWLNYATLGMFWPCILLAFFLILFISQKNYETEKAFLSSAFSTDMVAFIFYLLGLVALDVLVMCTIGVVVGVFIVNKSQGTA